MILPNMSKDNIVNWEKKFTLPLHTPSQRSGKHLSMGWGGRLAFKADHQQYLNDRENTEKINIFSIFLCGGICMYDTF